MAINRSEARKAVNLVLDRFQSCVAIALEREYGIYLQHPRLLWNDLSMNQERAVAIFAGMMASETLDTKTHILRIDIPLNWWEHFKQDCFPEWLLERFPVRRRTLRRECTFVQKEVYPQFHKYFPKAAGASFRVVTLEPDYSDSED